jgi:hypothetical protein
MLKPILALIGAVLWMATVVVGCGGGGYGGAKSADAPGSMAESAAAPMPVAGAEAPEPGAWKRSALFAHTAQIKIGDRDELPVRAMQAKVTIDGFMARVILDYQFSNDRDSSYEGTFQLRLPDGASPYFFAFGETVLVAADSSSPAGGAAPLFSADESRRLGADPAEIMAERATLWRGPKEARIVPKEKAALAYGATVRRAVDPALLEWSGPSIFSARVFPLAARRLHRVVIGYDVELNRVGEDLEVNFDLPDKVPSTAVDFSIADLPGVAVEMTPAQEPAKASGRHYYRFETPAARTLTARLKRAGSMAISATDPKTGPYFAATFRPDLPASGPARAADNALFLVDTSLSSNPDRFNIWLKLLTAILDNNRDTMKKFAVLFFNIETSFYQPQFIDNTPANVDTLVRSAQTLALEGATDLHAALAQAVRPPWAANAAEKSWDLFLLSDAASTWGEGDLFALSRTLQSGSAGALYAYHTGLAGTDSSMLSHLTRESGGAVFSVTTEADVKTASVAHRSRPYRLAGIKIAGGSDVLIAGRPKTLFPGQTLLVAGRGTLEKEPIVELSVDGDGGSRVVKAKLARSVASPLAIRAYGQIAVAQLEELDNATEAFSTAFATHFRVTGETCSLLMLETEADYARFNIRPEENALVVKQREASRIVQDTLSQVLASLGNPKATFMSWLDGLPRAPGVSLQVPTALRLMLEGLPESSFRVEAKPLAVTRRDRSSIPQPILAQLATHQLDYDALSADADRRLRQFGAADALKALSSLVEENPGDGVLARDVGFAAMTWGLPGDAYHLFRRVARSRPFEPQTYRGMAQCLTGMNQIDLAMVYFEIGLAGHWDQRFGEFRKILGIEYLHLLRRIAAGEVKTNAPDFARARLQSVASEFPMGRADILIMITWNTDATDVDLHVIEPNGEDCHYAQRQTSSGGLITQDVTQGYGPEMYTIARAPAGTYQVRAHYYASDRNRASTRTKVQATVFENWGTPQQRVTQKIVALESGKEFHEIATVVRRAAAVAGR